MFNNKNIVLIVTGGVAAYKAATFARLLIKEKATVRVVLTSAASEFITDKTFAALTQQPVLTDLFDNNVDYIAHISLADWADYIFVVPTTANMIAKIAHGIADDAASAVILARHTPLIVVPAMNVNMYENPAVQRNLAQLKADGVFIIEPVTGLLAEGYVGKGRMPEPLEILKQSELKLRQKDGQLKGRKVIVTAGGTLEPIDPVRYISNRSSGKMGLAFAQAASEAGAEVLLITTSNLSVPFGVEVKRVETAQQMLDAILASYDWADLVVMAAAVADYRFSQPAKQKIKKQTEHQGLHLDLVENPDILAQLGAAKTHQYLIGFAAETDDLLAHASEKLKKKHVDMLLANDVSKENIGFGYDTNELLILEPEKSPLTLPLAPKLELARQILLAVAKKIK